MNSGIIAKKKKPFVSERECERAQINLINSPGSLGVWVNNMYKKYTTGSEYGAFLLKVTDVKWKYYWIDCTNQIKLIVS